MARSTTTSSANAYYSFGCVTVGGSVSYNYNMTYAQGNIGWNVGIGAAWNPNMPYSSHGQSMGIELCIMDLKTKRFIMYL